MVLAATMTSVSESSAKHRRGMARVENYDLNSRHVPGLSGLHLWCAGGRLYIPTRIRRRLAVYQSACSKCRCSTCVTPVVRGLVEKTSVLRASVSSTTLTVSSIEELNTRSMSLHTRPCDLLVTDDSHMSDAISSRALSTSRHFWPCTQMGLRSGVRARFDTVSSTEHRSPNAGRVGT